MFYELSFSLLATNLLSLPTKPGPCSFSGFFLHRKLSHLWDSFLGSFLPDLELFSRGDSVPMLSPLVEHGHLKWLWHFQ